MIALADSIAARPNNSTPPPPECTLHPSLRSGKDLDRAQNPILDGLIGRTEAAMLLLLASLRPLPTSQTSPLSNARTPSPLASAFSDDVSLEELRAEQVCLVRHQQVSFMQRLSARCPSCDSATCAQPAAICGHASPISLFFPRAPAPPLSPPSSQSASGSNSTRRAR